MKSQLRLSYTQLASNITKLQNSNIYNETVKSSTDDSIIIICISVLNMSRLFKNQFKNLEHFFQRLSSSFHISLLKFS